MPCDRLLEYVLSLSKAKVVFVATDKNPMTNDIEERFKKKKVLVAIFITAYFWCYVALEAVSFILFCFRITKWMYLC